MEKIEIPANTVCFPMPVSIIGANVDGKPNFLTAAWFTMGCLKPPCIMVTLGKTHYTNPGIKENKCFSISIPSVSMAEVTDFCGIVSGSKHDKSKTFEVFYGKLEKAPMIKGCPYTAECRLIQVVDLHGEEIFIGEIAGAYIDEKCLTDGMPDFKKIDPLMLTVLNPKYYSTGPEVGPAWKIGKNLLKKSG